MTDIFRAIENNSIGLVEKCIDSGIDLNNTLFCEYSKFYNMNFYYTPLQYAEKCNCKVDLIEFLLKNGADPKQNGGISLYNNYKYRDEERVRYIKLLLSYGVENDASLHNDLDGYNPIEYEAIKLLILNGTKPNGLDLLISRHYSNKFISSTIKLFLENGADVNKKVESSIGHNEKCKTDLCSKSIYNCSDKNLKIIVPLFLKYGIDVNTRDDEGKTMLMYATRSSRLSIIKLLLKNGADVNATDNFGRTALFYYFPFVESAELLIKHGININHQDNDGNTVLHHYFNNLGTYAKYTKSILILLLDQDNIDLNLRDNNGNTVIESAMKSLITTCCREEIQNSINLIKRRIERNYNRII